MLLGSGAEGLEKEGLGQVQVGGASKVPRDGQRNFGVTRDG